MTPLTIGLMIAIGFAVFFFVAWLVSRVQLSKRNDAFDRLSNSFDLEVKSANRYREAEKACNGSYDALAKRLSEIAKQHAEEIKALDAGHKVFVKDLNETFDNEIATLKASHEQAIKELKENLRQKKDKAGHFTFDGNDCPKCRKAKEIKASVTKSIDDMQNALRGV